MKKGKGNVVKCKALTREKPFSDYYGGGRILGGWVHPKTGRASFAELSDQIKKNPNKESDKLRVLVNIYERSLQEIQNKSLNLFWKRVEEHKKEGLLSQDEWNCLINAQVAGTVDEPGTQHIKAVQELVKANPLTVRLPFVANALINILRRYRNTFTPKKRKKLGLSEEPGVSEIENRICAEDIKQEWEGFLPPRKKSPYSGHDLQRLIATVRKEERLNITKAEERVKEELGNIGLETLKKKKRIR